MRAHGRQAFRSNAGALWTGTAPVREELFGVERLEQHAESLAAAQAVTARPVRVPPLRRRLDADARALLVAYRESAADLEAGRVVGPAAAWLLDNYHVVEEQAREVREALPPRYYRELPKLAEGHLAGAPRVLGVSWAYVAHTDSNYDPDVLQRFIEAYQRVQPLTIGELWAVAITLRFVLIENLRRVADQIAHDRHARAEADALADRIETLDAVQPIGGWLLPQGVSEAWLDAYAAQLVKRLRDQDPRLPPAMPWLEATLQRRGSSVDEVVLRSQQSEAAANVTVRNIITSLRRIAGTDWVPLFERMSLVDRRLRAGSGFAAMDLPTRDCYRNAIEDLARGCGASELDVSEQLLRVAAKAAAAADDPVEADRVGDPGYHLIAGGRSAFERTIGYQPPFASRARRTLRRWGLGGFVATLSVVLALLMAAALAVSGLRGGWLLAFGLALLLPLSEAAMALVHRMVMWRMGTRPLPALDLERGVPDGMRTLVVVPTLLSTEEELQAQVEQLEVHHLASADRNLAFALLTDGVDADRELLDGEEAMLGRAVAAVDALNLRYGPGSGGDRFHLLHRRRVFNAAEGVWMGWERKRGKLRELNRLLRGATDTTFMPLAGRAPRLPEDVRFVITLDADTRLPRGAALKLIGKMAHPLLRPRFSQADGRVVSGYGVLQPRVTAALPDGLGGSVYHRLYAAASGMDPYAAAVSDVYQDLFGEGSFTGKGIYDVDAFEASLAGRVPENLMLSHDLFEGTFARAGLASDVEVVEEAPSRYDVDAKRRHRWTRGDWQLLPWLLGPRRGPKAVPALGRWKMLDNLRRSLLAPVTFLALGLAWVLPERSATAVGLLLAAMLTPILLPIVAAALPRRPGVRWRSHLVAFAGAAIGMGMRAVLAVALLADEAWRMTDAIVRALWRLFLSRRLLLEWTTMAQSTGTSAPGIRATYRMMAGGASVGLLMALAAVLVRPQNLLLVLPFVLLWSAAPGLVAWVSRPPTLPRRAAFTEEDAKAMRLIARRTWRFFENFVTPDEHMLPPDNFQEDPTPVVARRTSPTNIGLYLLSAAVAREQGWAGTFETVERLEATFATLARLPRFRGHLYNWYGTADLEVLAPGYVSSVDSGNLAGHLIALANVCEGWAEAPMADAARRGMTDDLSLAQAALAGVPDASGDLGRRMTAAFDAIETKLAALDFSDTAVLALERRIAEASFLAGELLPSDDEAGRDLRYWIGALGRAVMEHRRDRLLLAQGAEGLRERLLGLAAEARETALGMDFAFLLQPERKLLSIGYSLADHRLDESCYDLLASEARLASLVAIAKGDVEAKHWFRMGRTAVPVGTGSALVSWSGSMFEYLMPQLVMSAPVGSLLEQTERLAVQRHRHHGRSLGVPWGSSESAFNARDVAYTYQYGNFGVPTLGLKRGLSENVVIAPYATGLATMVDPGAACSNYQRLEAMGALGRHGFYEALDFTPSRVPEGERFAIVRCFMAHHQGMTIVAIANALDGGWLRHAFHREPMVRASELLLQERPPREANALQPRAEEAPTPIESWTEVSSERRFGPQAMAAAPLTHLLSNGRYVVMLTAAGAGYSHWNDQAVTRWREDVTRDQDGSFVFLRDVGSDEVWSPTARPLRGRVEDHEVVFAEDHARFSHRAPGLTTEMDVLVTNEGDGEVRRVSITNRGRQARVIDVTSYAELVLTDPAADRAHPAFAKMFVQTEYRSALGALLATRRRRTPEEQPLWAAHLAVVEGETMAEPQYETDRARFLGRGRWVGAASAVHDGKRLSNSVGTVLDPVFSLRHRLRVLPGQTARVAYWTLLAPDREQLLDLIDTHRDPSAFERARTLAWTQAQLWLRYLDVGREEATTFQRLASAIVYADPRFRPSSETLVRGAGPQAGLWPHAISGDLPIVLLRIDDAEDMPLVRQLLRAQEYWRSKRLEVDLVIVNEHASSYLQDLQMEIESAVRSSQGRPRMVEGTARGSVFTLRADLVSTEVRALLLSAARVVLVARRGSLARQVERLRSTPTSRAVLAGPSPAALPPTRLPPPGDLEFFNGLGGFADDGREYVTVLEAGRSTPTPWINVIANPGFGFQVSAEGSGYTWAENSRENQLSPWSNDPVVDAVGEAFYLRDEVSGELWSPTARPIRDAGTYIARHGHGYSRFEHEVGGIASELLQFVPLNDPVKVSRLSLTNRSGSTRRISVTSYLDWVLGTSRRASAPFLITETDAQTGAVFARQPWSTAFPGRVAFSDLPGTTALTADRTEFLGRGGGPEAPAALLGSTPLSGAVGAGLDPCAVLQRVVEIAPGETVVVDAFLGQGRSAEEARALVQRYRAADLETELAAVRQRWRELLGAVQVRTPDRAMDIMLNGWLLYQTLACRVWARSAFYQASGAYGFRDQLQDTMALTFVRPEATREHLLRAAGRQFLEGDVQHWWLPHSGQGVRTHISDDRVWLAFAAASYVGRSGDHAVLDEAVPFLDGLPLSPDEHDAFFQPMVADQTASLFEHCARALDQAVELTGRHGLPLIGGGDWNDGMNRVGHGGQGESVWLGWFLLHTLELFVPLAEARGTEANAERASRWSAHARSLREAIEGQAWDGRWYRRATFDDGTWLGSRDNEACRIDSIAQSWAVLSGAADPERAATAMASVGRQLVRRDEGLVLLFTPPFDRGALDPGYIKAYPPGLRENGGQYSHAAMWAVLAFARLGQGEQAAELFGLLNPIHHARTAEGVERYKVEPYVVAADVYSVPPHAGRGGWTWYTGSAGWMYRAGMEGILGIRREGDSLVVEPCLPSEWPGFEATVQLAGTSCTIHVKHDAHLGGDEMRAVLDEVRLPCPDGLARLPLDGGRHHLELSIPLTGLRRRSMSLP